MLAVAQVGTRPEPLRREQPPREAANAGAVARDLPLAQPRQQAMEQMVQPRRRLLERERGEDGARLLDRERKQLENRKVEVVVVRFCVLG